MSPALSAHRTAPSRRAGHTPGFVIPKNYASSRHLTRQREARTLVSVGPAPDDGQLVRLAPLAAIAWRRMRAAASLDGIVLLPLSGFRSVARQTEIIRAKLAAGQSLESILEFVMAPGFSEHHTGRALDIGSPDSITIDGRFGHTAAFRWLRRQAGKFGFHLSFPRRNHHGIGYEPWHWCWRRKK
jgi:D-alanyl-D-alanine carboxypeptidase